MKTKDAYTELAIQIATLDMKLDAILKLLNKPEIEIQPIKIIAPDHYRAEVDVPPQWPNESRTDYLKRIGQWNEASSDGEKFSEEFK